MRTPEELPSRRLRSEAVPRSPRLPASSRALGARALRPLAPRSPRAGSAGQARAAGRRGGWAERGRRRDPSGSAWLRRGGRGAEFGGAVPDSGVRMAAAGSGPHLGSPTLAARDARQASAPQAPGPCGGTPGLPPSQDGYTFVPAAQAIPLQVDMAMALQRVRISEKYGQSYLCLLQAVFVAGKCPPRARRPGGLGSRPAGPRLRSPLRSQPGRQAGTLCLRSHPAPPSPLPGRPRPPAAVVPRAGRGAAGGRRCGEVSAAAGPGYPPHLHRPPRCRVAPDRWGRTASSQSASRRPEAGLPRPALPFE